MKFILEKWAEDPSETKLDLKSMVDGLELSTKLEWVDKGNHIQLYLWDDNIWNIAGSELDEIEEYGDFNAYYDDISAAINVYPEEGRIEVLEPGDGKFNQSFDDKEEMIEEIKSLIKQFDTQIYKKEIYILDRLGAI